MAEARPAPRPLARSAKADTPIAIVRKIVVLMVRDIATPRRGAVDATHAPGRRCPPIPAHGSDRAIPRRRGCGRTIPRVRIAGCDDAEAWCPSDRFNGRNPM